MEKPVVGLRALVSQSVAICSLCLSEQVLSTRNDDLFKARLVSGLQGAIGKALDF